MWWKDYTEEPPKFVKAFNAKSNISRESLTDEVERMAWNYHFSYLYNQMIYEQSEGYGYYEVVSKRYLPTGYALPCLVKKEEKCEPTEDTLKQRATADFVVFYAGVCIFQTQIRTFTRDTQYIYNA